MEYAGFIGGSARVRSLDVSAARAVNLYPTVVETGAQPQGALVSIPGLRLHTRLPRGPVRGLYTASSGRVFAVGGDRLCELFTAGPALERGRLQSQTGVVSMTDNGRLLVLVDGAQGYGLDLVDHRFSVSHDPEFQGGTTIGFLDGRFVWNIPGTGQYQWSDLYSPEVDGMAFATAEARPDPLVGLLVDTRELWLFGSQTTEVMYSTGDPYRPFERLPGALMEVGCVSPWCMASQLSTVFWVSASADGHGMVMAAQGYQPQRLSTPALEYALAQSKRLSEAVGLTYTQEGQSWYGLYVPDLETSWWYDLTTKQWSERGTLWANSLQSVGADPVWYPWRPYLHTFGVGQALLGSWEDDAIYALDPTSYTDAERALVRMRVAPTIRAESEWLQIGRLRVIMETGVGLDQGAVPGGDPQVMLRLSRDGGHTWDNARWATAHALGRYGRTVEWRRLGRARQLTAELTISDPVPVTLLGAFVA